MKSDKLDLIADESCKRLKEAISEAHDDILQAWEQVNAQAIDDEKDPVLTVSFAIKLDLGANSLVTQLTYGVRRKIEQSGEIPDPSQPSLPLEVRGDDGTRIGVIHGIDQAIDRAKKRKRGAK